MMEEKLEREQNSNLQNGKVLTALIMIHNLTKSKESYAAVLRCLADNPVVWVPMNISVSPEDLQQFLGGKKGDTITTKDVIRMKPDILKNPEGKLFFPAFSTQEEAPEQYRNHFSWVQMPFKETLRYLWGRNDLEAVVINAFSQSIIIPVPLLTVIAGGEG